MLFKFLTLFALSSIASSSSSPPGIKKNEIRRYSYCNTNKGKKSSECSLWISAKEANRTRQYPGVHYGVLSSCPPVDLRYHIQFRIDTYNKIFPIVNCNLIGVELGALHQPANIPQKCNNGRKFVDKWPKEKPTF